MKYFYTLTGRLMKWVNDIRWRWLLARIEGRLNSLKTIKQA